MVTPSELFLPFHWLCWCISIAASSLHPLVKGSELLPCGRHHVKHVLPSNPTSQGSFSCHTGGPSKSEEREEASSPKARWPQDTRACTLSTMAKPWLALQVAMQSVLFVEPTCRQGEMLSRLGGCGYEQHCSPPAPATTP